MNKFIRGLLITFGVCLAVGGGLLIAGIALGGTWDDATVVIGEDSYDMGNLFSHGILRFGDRTSYSGDSDTQESEAMTGELKEAAKEIRDLEMTLHSCELQISLSKDD